MVVKLGILAVIQCLLWAPIAYKFFKTWKKRKNPLSLAICLNIFYIIYVGAVPYWISSKTDIRLAIGTMLVFNLLVCSNFWLAIRNDKTKFNSKRKKRQ